MIANGVLVIGNSGAEFGVRGFIDGYDTATGKQLWRRYTIPAKGEKGNETWPQDSNAWEAGGGSAWITGSYDPELDLMYWGTGNPAPWASQSRPGDNLYTSSVLAMRPKTGEIVWHYQFTPNDAYDYDACWELIIADKDIGGTKRKVIMQLNRNGFLYVIDRTNGQLLAANPFAKVNWASHIDKETGRPVETEVAKKLRNFEQIEHWPSTTGGKNWPHAAYSPETGLLYANTINQARMFKHLPTKAHVVGQRYMYVENIPIPLKPGEATGHIEAIDPLTAQGQVAGAAHRLPDLVGDAGDRQRPAVHRQGNRRIHRARRRHRPAALAVPDRFRHQRHAGHLHAQRQAIRHGAVRHRRTLLERAARAAQGQGAARRLGLDLRGGRLNRHILHATIVQAAWPQADSSAWAFLFGPCIRLGEIPRLRRACATRRLRRIRALRPVLIIALGTSGKDEVTCSHVVRTTVGATGALNLEVTTAREKCS